MFYKLGDKVAWRSLNKDYAGEVVGFRGRWALVKIDGSPGHILLQNEDYVVKPLNGNKE